MAWTLCTSGSAIAKAGADANSVIIADATKLAQWSDEAEALIATTARSDVVTNFSSLTANGKKVLGDIAASYIAQQIVVYGLGGYTSRAVAETNLDVLENNIQRGLKLISEDKNKTYLGIT